MSPKPAKRITVILRRPPSHPQTAHGLRSAVGYTTVGLLVRIVLVGAAQDLGMALAQLTPPTQRAVATLTALGCLITACSDGKELTEICTTSDVVVCW